MTAWTDFATDLYKKEKAKNADFTFSDALKKAGKLYKKGGQVGGKFNVNGEEGEGEGFIYNTTEEAAAAAAAANENTSPVDDAPVDDAPVAETVDDAPATVVDAASGGKKRRTKKSGRKSTKKGGRKSAKKSGRKSAKK